MSGSDHHPAGAATPQGIALQAAMASIGRLALSDRHLIECCDLNTCDRRLQELLDYADDPTGKPELTVTELLAKIVFISQRKTLLMSMEHQKLQRSYSTLQQRCMQLEEEIRAVRQGSQVNTEDEMPALEVSYDAPRPAPPVERTGSAEHSRLREELKAAHVRETVLLRALQAVQPVQQDSAAGAAPPMRGRTPPSAVAQHAVTLDSYRAPPVARSHDLHTPPPVNTQQARTSRTPLRADWVEPPPQTRSGTTGFDLPFTRETQCYPRNPSLSPLPRQGRDSYPPRYDVSESSASDDSDGPEPARRSGLRTRQLESLARDIERFDPSSRDSNVDDYLREVDRCLLDLPHANSREKLKLIWKTTARNVHVFMETLQPGVRERYSTLCQALREEYSPYVDQASAALGAFSIVQERHEPPREYYQRLRSAYFQGRNAPGLEEDQAFKSLFLHNLHESLRYDVTMHCRTRNLSMAESRRYAQVAWETHVRPSRRSELVPRVLGIQASENIDLEGSEVPQARPNWTRPRRRQPPRPRGGHHNREDEDRGRPRYPAKPTPKRKVRFERNRPEREDKGLRTTQEGFTKQEMVDMVHECVTEVMKQLNKPHDPSPVLQRTVAVNHHTHD